MKNILSTTIQICADCELHTSNKILGHGGKSVLICDFMPKKIISNNNLALCDKSNELFDILQKLFTNINWSVQNTYFTNLIKCQIFDDKFFDESIMNKCFRRNFMQELFFVNPFAIIVFDERVKKFLDARVDTKIYPIFLVEHYDTIKLNYDNKFEAWVQQWRDIKFRVQKLIQIMNV